jgi:ribosomal protein L40E
MFWLTSVTCEVCKVSVPKRQTMLTLERGFGAVCRTCYQRWDRSARVCAKCHRPVNGLQSVGLFADAGGLGHADCGGALLGHT